MTANHRHFLEEDPEIHQKEPIQPAQDDEQEQGSGSYSGGDLGDSSDTDRLAAMKDSIDVETFRQIPEIDDPGGETDREFSKSVILSALALMEDTIRKMHDIIINHIIHTDNINGFAYSLRGQSSSIGLTKVSKLAAGIRLIPHDDSLSDEEKTLNEKQFLHEIKEAFADGKNKFRAFYREELEEAEW